MNEINIFNSHLETPIGWLHIVASAVGLRQVYFSEAPPSVSNENVHTEAAKAQLAAYFEGKRQVFDLIFDWTGTAFQQRVWQQLLEIPFGKTLSYSALSQKMGDIKAIRAVGTANGANPIAIIVPCHRVIGSDGSLTGYAGGLHRKKWLLDLENPPRQTQLFEL